MTILPSSSVRWAALGAGVLALAVGVGMPSSQAQPPGPEAFCEVYADAPACAAGVVACATCHTGPPTLNVYGEDVAAHLAQGEARPLHEDQFTAGLGEALAAVEGLDSDGDGFTNLEEIAAGSLPSDAESQPETEACEDRNDEDGYFLCGYDLDYAYKKVMLDFCGRSPTLMEREVFAKDRNASDALHEVLDVCLDSEHWQGIDGRVWNLANRKIGPQAAVKSGANAGPIPLADYDDDFAYFVWSQTDDRDVRVVLTGQTFVSARYEGGRTVYEEWDRSPSEDAAARGYDAYQGVDKGRRAGLLTHRWFLMVNTMFTSVPRTTAAQAYRAFLGYDISRLEGLRPVEGEPVDYDSKGVQTAECAACHSTLDPLTYPFSRYEGIGGGNADSYSYSARRMMGFVSVDGPLVADTPEAGVLLGQPVADLVEWAEVAANSEPFRRATVLDYWRLLLGEEPRVTEQAEFATLIDSLGTTWKVEQMLHDFIDTEAYGAP